MNPIRLFKCSEIYHPAYRWFLQNFPEGQNLSYQQHLSLLFRQRIQWADFWKQNLEATGAFVVEEVLRNATEIQNKWALENKIEVADPVSLVIQQAKAFQPDVFFAHSFPTGSADLIARLRREVPSIRLVIGWDGIAHCSKDMFVGRDMMFTCADFITAEYKKAGVLAHTVPFAFEETVLEDLGPVRPRPSPSFLGTLHLGGGGHNERIRLLYELQEKSGHHIDLYTSTPTGSMFENVQVALGYLKRFEFDVIPKASHLMKNSLGPRFGLEMFRAFAESPVTVNAHIDVAKSFAGNIRLFDATGCGACLLTDHKDNLSQYFEIDKEIVTFKSRQDCLEKLEWLMDHESERVAIARAGQEKTLKQHSYRNRLAQVAAVISSAVA